MRSYKPYIPQTLSELKDQIGSMMLSSPTFKDKTGYFPEQSIDTVFFALSEGLKVNEQKLGSDRYHALLALSHRMRMHFEADPEDQTDDAIAGRELIMEMQKLLTKRAPQTIRDSDNDD